jgi:hypothetical protein
MLQTFNIRPREGAKKPTISSVAQPGDFSLEFDLTTDTEARDVRNYLDCITRIEVQPVQAGLKSVYVDSNRGRLPMRFGKIALVSFVVCAGLLYYGYKDYPTLSLVVAAVWTVAVPLYFFWEHEFWFFKYGNPAEFEQFKRVQDLAAKIWVGALAVFGAIVYHQIPH